MANNKLNIIGKSLKNKNILTIDDGDLSISYRKSSINNTEEYKPDLQELYDFFKNDNDSIFRYNTSNCITFILNNGEEIPLNNYYKHVANKPKILKISNDMLKAGGNEILIACNRNHHIPDEHMKWRTNVRKEYYTPQQYKNKNDEEDDFSGYDNCVKIADVFNNMPDKEEGEDIPAIRYCFKETLKTGPYNYQGYLPSAGQIKIIQDYIDMINYIFKVIKKEPLKMYDNTVAWHTSTVASAEYIWIGWDRMLMKNKGSSAYCILPIYKRV